MDMHYWTAAAEKFFDFFFAGHGRADFAADR
jgi:hypothetical protein